MSHGLRSGYLRLQQSPGQQEDCCWQQLWLQQLPAQHLASFLQQVAPVTASADNENSAVAINAKTLVFMEFPLRVSSYTGAEAQDTHRWRGLDPQIVFEVEDGSAMRGTGDSVWQNGGGALSDRLFCGRCAAENRRFDCFTVFGLLKGLFRALYGGASGSITARKRATGHVVTLAVHDRSDRGTGRSQRYHPNAGKNCAQEATHAPLQGSDHDASLGETGELQR